MFCNSYFVNEVKACACVWDVYGAVWLEGCKERADQGSLKFGLQNKVVTIGPSKRDYKVVRIFIWGLSCVGCDWLQVVEVVWMTVGKKRGASWLLGVKKKKSHINGLEFL